MFATHGLPDVVISDNGTVFASDTFKQFVGANGILHVKTPPYHRPASNGQAERIVQKVKKTLKRMNGDWIVRISRFLLNQRSTPCTVTGHSPAELMMNKKLKTALSQIIPDKLQMFQKEDDNVPENQLIRSFGVRAEVLAREYRQQG